MMWRLGQCDNMRLLGYDDEPADNKLSPDAADITVIFETATTGGGTATIEVN